MAYDVNEGAKQALDNYQSIKNNYRFNAGMDILGQMYGPVAWAPEQAMATENYLYAKQNNPLLLQQQGITNQQNQQNLDYSRQADPLRVKGLGLINESQAQTNAFNAQNDPLRVQQGQQTVQAGADAQAAADAARTKQALAGLVGTLGQQVGAGADPAATFDAAMADISALTGYPPEQLAPYRSMFIKDPAGTVTRLQTALGAVDASAMTQAERDAATQAQLEAQKTQAETANLGADNARQDALIASQIAENQAATAKLAGETTAAAAKSAAELGLSTDVYDAQITAAKLDAARAPLAALGGEDGYFAQADALISELASNPMVNAGSIKTNVGAAAEFNAAIQPILSSLTLQQMAVLEEAGVNLTPMSDTDRQTLTNSVGMLDARVVPPSQLKKNLAMVLEVYNKAMTPLDISAAKAAKDVEKLGGMLPSDEGFVPGPRPAPTKPKASGGDSSTAEWQRENLTTLKASNGQTWQVNSAAAPAFEGFMADLEALGYSPVSSGGYNYRNKRGGGTGLSEHATGNAIDINATVNAQGQTKNDLPPNVGELAAKWGLRWGGTFSNPDPMHFEYVGPGAVHPGNSVAAAPAPGGAAGMEARQQGTLVDEGGIPALDAARAAAVAPAAPAPQPVQPQVAERVAAPQQAVQPAPGPVGGQMLPDAALRNPDFVIPGSGGQTVGQALMQAREALKRGWTMEQVAAQAQRFGLPTEMITGRQR